MNLLGFLAIVIAVTGLIWLLQMIFKGKDRIDINLSVGRSTSSSPEKSTTESSSKQPQPGAGKEADSIMGDVVTVGRTKPSTSGSPVDSSVSAKSTTETSQSDTTRPELTDEDAYLDQGLEDEQFVEHTNESLLQEVPTGDLKPPLGQLTFSAFGSLATQLPEDSFEKPQNAQQIEAMFELLRESTRRIEEQMIALYEVHRSTQATQNAVPSATSTKLEIPADTDWTCSKILDKSLSNMLKLPIIIVQRGNIPQR